MLYLLHCPSLFSDTNLPNPGTLFLSFPIPVLAQPDLSISFIVEVNLTDLSLDECPDTPVKSWNTSEQIYLGHEALNFSFQSRAVKAVTVLMKALKIMLDELATSRASWNEIVIAIKTAPFSEVVGDVESTLTGSGVSITC